MKVLGLCVWSRG